MSEQVRILDGCLDETPEGRMFVRGVIDVGTMDLILTPEYQREMLCGDNQKELMAALKAHAAVPDVELGMRGDRVDWKGKTFTLLDSVYVIDGLQRISAAREIVKNDPGAKPHLGARVHVNTTEGEERKLFNILNTKRNRCVGLSNRTQ